MREKKIETKMNTKIASKIAARATPRATAKSASKIFLAVILAGVMMLAACKSAGIETSEITDGTIVAAEISVAEIAKEPTETVAATTTTKATQKITATPKPTAKESEAAATTKTAETEASVVTTKETAATATTIEEAAVTMAVLTVETAVLPVETSPPVATTAAFTPNCDNIRSLIVSNLQSRGYLFPDEVSIGGGSAALTTNYYYTDELFAEGFLLKFTNIDKTGTGVISVSVWIENGYVNFSYDKCAYPTA